MVVQTQIRHLDDTEVAIAATLQRPDGTVVNLTGLTVKFKMTNQNGTVKLAATSSNVTVTDVANGQCQYAPQAVDVNTEGIFYGYFTVTDDSENVDTFPVRKGNFRIAIQADV